MSLRVGLPREYGTPGAKEPMHRPWRTGFFKDAVRGSIFLGRTNLDGDGQADLRVHGGPDKAVCVYPAARYPYWRERLGLELPYGSFGENFTVAGLDEDSVCIGDIFEVGEALVEVSQPRSPCWKLARRWGEKKLALWVQQTGFTGWYFRVLEEGEVACGQALRLRERPHPEWTVMRANAVRYDPARALEDAAALANLPALGESWRTKLALAAKRQLSRDESRRLIGENRED
ncbi:MOSC domain-containing protein [Bradymonas sediminis]|uniref:MOSC domain-containing protein n=1 Tax=Bradymonas sediminis TaxID=1548548 RepID=A0A2Z4FIA0_9DELT|nr:MOSC domain-containing protein [Bradymonas sediminis]AWV88662.1 MOSC domain-containing protein [Bradymonas sediminis]TDP63653.1 MOSC domain-containing protein YiiM [Bradymonas sediminis]